MPKKKEKIKKYFMKVSNSRKIYLPIYFMILVLIAVVIFIKYNDLSLSTPVLVLVVLFILFSIKFTELHRWSNSYEITKDAFIHNKGILNRKTRSMDFLAISDVERKQNIWQRLLNYGDVSVRLYSGESDNPAKNINNPKKFADCLQKMIHAKRRESSNW